MAVYSGADTVVVYMEEATYGTTPTWLNTAYHFGPGVKISNIKRANGTKPIWGLGTRQTQAVAVGTFAGSFDVEFALSTHTQWMSSLYGDTSAPYGTVGANKGISVLVATDPTLSTNTLWAQLTVFQGCICTSAKFSMEAGENPVMCTASFIYLNELTPVAASKTVATYPAPSSNWDSGSIFSFGQISLKTINGVTTYVVERAEVSITSASKFIYGLGKRTPQGKADAPCEFTATATILQEDETLLRTSYDGVGGASVTAPSATTFGAMSTTAFGISSGGVTLTFTNPYITSHGNSYTIGEAIMQDVELMGTLVTVALT